MFAMAASIRGSLDTFILFAVLHAVSGCVDIIEYECCNLLLRWLCLG